MDYKKDKILGTLFGLAIGDGFGYPNEFLNLESQKSKWGEKGLLEPLAGAIKVTDDTQMALAVSKAIQKSFKKNKIKKNDFEIKLIYEFINWYVDENNDRDPGKTCLSACRKLSKGYSWRQSTSSNSKGCGANMRVAPLSLLSLKSDFFSLKYIAELSQFQAAFTHAHPTAITASELTAIAIHKNLNGTKSEDLLDELIEYTKINKEIYHKDWLEDLWKHSSFDNEIEFISHGWIECHNILIKVKEGIKNFKQGDDPCSHIGEGWLAEEALGISLLCYLLDPDNTKNVLIRAINTNGDSDTIGCISGAISGAKNGFKSIPKDWVSRIEYREELLNYSDFILS